MNAAKKLFNITALTQVWPQCSSPWLQPFQAEVNQAKPAQEHLLAHGKVRTAFLKADAEMEWRAEQ